MAGQKTREEAGTLRDQGGIRRHITWSISACCTFCTRARAAAFGDKPRVSSLASTQPIAVGRRKFKEICKKLRE